MFKHLICETDIERFIIKWKGLIKISNDADARQIQGVHANSTWQFVSTTAKVYNRLSLNFVVTKGGKLNYLNFENSL